jgi:hypothetical protein
MRRDRLRFGPVLPWFGFVAFAALGLFLMGRGATWWLEYRRSEHWPRADAFIDRVAPRWADSPGDNPDPRVECDYHFTFAGKEHHGTRVSLTGQGSYAEDDRGNKTWEFDELERHRATATPVRCWVNPKDPARSVLFRRAEPRMYWLPLAGLAFGLWSPMFPFLYYRQQRAP